MIRSVSLVFKAFFVLMLLLFPLREKCHAVCGGMPLNPVTDVAWQSIFPIKIGGVRIGTNTDTPPVPTQADIPVCVCPIPTPPFIRMGLTLEFWEPTNIIETVKDPFCFPTIGYQLLVDSKNGMTSHDGGATKKSFGQTHIFDFPVWSMMEMLTDFICVEQSMFDVTGISEIDPFWQEDSAAMIQYPEVLLFANPIAQLSCVPDSVSSALGMPLDPLFWCAGSFGSIYPLTGTVLDNDYVQAQGTLAARTVYLQARRLVLTDHAINICTKMITPIWVKSHYKYQLAKPVRGIGAINVGRTSILWGSLKNPPLGGTGTPDNFAWILFKKRVCCAY